MPKRFVFNMGYDTSHVTSVLTSEGLEDDSEVYLIVPDSIDDRQRNSIADIRNYIDSLNLEIELACFEADEGLESNILKFSELFPFSGKTILSLSGGPRDHLVPLTLAASLNSSEIDQFYFRSDLDSDIENLNVPDLHPDLSDTDKQILKAIESKYSEASEIEQEVDASDSTVYRRIRSLLERNLVEEKDLNGSSSFRATTSARVILGS